MLKNAISLTVMLCTALLTGCDGVSVGPEATSEAGPEETSEAGSEGTSEAGSAFNNGSFRTSSLIEDFETGANDSVTATLNEDGTTITENGTISNGNTYVITHDLDALGRLLKRTITEQDGTTRLTQSYTYGANGYPATQVQVASDNSERRDNLEWTMDNKIDLYTRTNLDAEGELEGGFTFDFTYNDGLLVSMREEPVPNPGGISREFTYTVDANGRVMERVRFNSSGVLDRTTMWEYGDDGNQVVQTMFNADGNMTARLTSTYKATDRQVYNRTLFQQILTP